ncbi:MAG: NAD(P)/FAD-dependent oxidoreductase [Proteobacteria bacterium]|nr:NAD(P)/FAD-dependent oxidoreductase [Pseudomonadota bacterium]
MPALRADAVVIGAGPVGLFQVFQLGLQGLAAHVIDALPHVGGQCVQLYADKPIYDIPGIAHCTGRELVQRLTQQIAPFAPRLHLGQQVQSLQRLPEGGFAVGTTAGLQLQARCVFIAAGVGAFMPRTLKTEGLAQHQGRQLHYHPGTDSLGALCAARHTVVHGGDEAAVAAAIACAHNDAASVTLLHRRDVFDAPPELLQQLQQLRASGRIRVAIGQIAAQQTQAGRLLALQLHGPDGQALHLPLDQLLVYLGLTPRLGPVADWGLRLDRKQIVVDTAGFQTSESGIYAVGDVNHYPGKRKLILCGFHEATLAAFAAAEQLAGCKLGLEYTTSSARLQQLLAPSA